MNKEELIVALKAKKKTIPPGDPLIFDFEEVIGGLKYEHQAYGHSPLNLERAKKDYYVMAQDLLEMVIDQGLQAEE